MTPVQINMASSVSLSKQIKIVKTTQTPVIQITNYSDRFEK